jgi:hypothetical protein
MMSRYIIPFAIFQNNAKTLTAGTVRVQVKDEEIFSILYYKI